YRRMHYTAVGQTTHRPARMEQLAAPGSIRLTADALHLAEGFVQITPLGPVPIKGLGDPVEVFELVGAGAARTRLAAAAARGLTRVVCLPRAEVRNAHFLIGEREPMREHLSHAEVLARRLGDQQRLGRIVDFMGIESLVAGNYEEAARFGREACSI